MAVIFVLLFSYSTSPLYSGYYSYTGVYDSGDSAQFLTIGKAWSEGAMPYRDLFDHKGPLIFLVDMLGFLIGGGARYGIVLFQVIALFVALKYTFKLAELASRRKIWGVALALLLLVFYAAGYDGGNRVQEYCAPLIVMSLYYLARWLGGQKSFKAKTEHPPRWAFLYGLCVGAGLATQITNAVAVAPLILAVGICLLAGGKIRNFWKNLGAGLLGIAVVVLPFVIYFALNGALGEMLFACFTFNFAYAGQIGSWLRGTTAAEVNAFLLNYLPFLLTPLTLILAWRRGRRPYAVGLGLVFLVETYFFFTTSSFGQYAMPAVAQIALFANEILLVFNCEVSKPKRADHAPALALIFATALLAHLTFTNFNNELDALVNTYNSVKYAAASTDAGYEELMARVATGELACASFSAYGDIPVKGLYLLYDLSPHSRFFAIQRWHSGFSEQVKAEIKTDFSANSPDCLLWQYEQDVDGFVAELTATRYELIAENAKFGLFKLKAE